MPTPISELALSKMLGVSRHKCAQLLERAGLTPEGRLGTTKIIKLDEHQFETLNKLANQDGDVFQRRLEALENNPAAQAELMLSNAAQTATLLRKLRSLEQN
jgi:ribosomal protein S13